MDWGIAWGVACPLLHVILRPVRTLAVRIPRSEAGRLKLGDSHTSDVGHWFGMTAWGARFSILTSRFSNPGRHAVDGTCRPGPAGGFEIRDSRFEIREERVGDSRFEF